MRKVLMVACVLVIAAAANAHAASPVGNYIQMLANLPDSASLIPEAPEGCGAVRDELTGDFLLLVPREYCGTNTAPGYTVPLGHTTYGSKIIGYCQEF